MSKLEWIGFWTLLKKECLRFWKVKGQTVFSPLVNAGLYLVVFGVSLSGVLRMHSEFTYLQFLIPGLVALSSLNNSLQNSASSVMISKFHGDLQDLRYIPLSHHLIGIAYVTACIVRGTFVGFLVLGMGELVHFFQTGTLMNLAHPWGLLVFLMIGGAIFGNLGIWAGFLSKTFDHISSFTNFVILPLIYLGGVFYSIEILSPFWRTLATYNPLMYLINGIRWSILGVSDVGPLVCVQMGLIFVALTGLLAWYSVRYGSYQRF